MRACACVSSGERCDVSKARGRTYSRILHKCVTWQVLKKTPVTCQNVVVVRQGMRCTRVPTCSHLHVSSQGADPPLASSTGQEDGDDGQQGADSQQSTASRTEHCTSLRETQTQTTFFYGLTERRQTVAQPARGNFAQIHGNI